ncbi:MAG TPA: TIGR03560 family F420-dependent LLM class oxidoreductase [Acidimicrobiia bacterium]|nr:TIGR03560 family F420-dependent LLM class oxidoreductase [Acidimicrobiia bacterium]
MKLSINVTNYSWPGGDAGLASSLAHVASAAEAAGVDTVWVADHLLQADPTSEVHEPMLEAYTTLGYLAAATRRVRLGTMVSAASVRPAALLVKAVTTLDVLSGGRAWLGIGAGYQADEAESLGLPFPSTAERFDRLEETIRLALQMWAGDERPFRGRQLVLGRPISRPSPIGDRRPRLLIGGTGERRTIPLVARYADACNFFDIPDGGTTVRAKLDALRRACDEAGRDAGEIEKTISTRLEAGESAAAFLERAQTLADLGFEHLVLITTGPWTDRHLAALAEATAGLSPPGAARGP